MADATPPGLTLRHLTEDDLVAAATVFATSLGVEAPKEPERFANYWDLQRSLGAFDDRGRLLGVAATFTAEFTVEGGAAMPCAAVPSVGVRTDSHRRGVGRALLERQIREADEHGAAMLALNASEVAIYGRYGYGPTSRWWGLETATRTLDWRHDAPRAVPGSIEELDDADAVAAIVPALHRRVFGSWGGELSRPDSWWWGVVHPREGKPMPSFAVHRDTDGQVDASIAFTVENHFDDTGFANRVEVVDSIATDPGTELLLWRWLLDRRLLGTVKADRANPRLPLFWALEDPRRIVTKYDSDAAWARILDVPRVIGARTTTGAGHVAVRVVDDLVPGNDRVWSITGADGRLEVAPSDEDPALTVSIELLASLVWGFVGSTRLAQAGRIDRGDTSAHRVLDDLLATSEPSWCSTGF